MTAMQVPEYVASYAAGVCTVATEARWEEIAHFIQRLGMGRWTADQLHDAAQSWASRKGTNLSALVAMYRKASRG